MIKVYYLTQVEQSLGYFKVINHVKWHNNLNDYVHMYSIISSKCIIPAAQGLLPIIANTNLGSLSKQVITIYFDLNKASLHHNLEAYGCAYLPIRNDYRLAYGFYFTLSDFTLEYILKQDIHSTFPPVCVLCSLATFSAKPL